jgi:hypothetical protein
MKKIRLLMTSQLCIGILSIHASNINDINASNLASSMSIYKIKPEPDPTRMSDSGSGLYYNTQNIKLKVEKTVDYIKTGAILKVNPLENSLYVKFGGNYLNQNLYNYDTTKKNICQYSGALGIGYTLSPDVDLELGSNMTEVIGDNGNTENTITNQTIKETYYQIAKRTEIPIGTIDVTLKGNQLYQTLSTKEENYGSSFNYYPDKYMKLGYFYMNSQNNIYRGYSLNYGYFTTEYANNISENTYSVTVGLKAKFTDIMNFSSYVTPVNVKPKAVRLHRFDDMILSDNMNMRI